MSVDNPAALLVDVSGSLMAVTASLKIPSGTTGLIVAGVGADGTVRFPDIDSNNALKVTGSLTSTPSGIQNVTGSVAITEQVRVTVTSSLPVHIDSQVSVNNFPVVQAISGSVSVYTQGAQLVSGAVNLSNWPQVTSVSGSQLTGSTFAGMPVVAGGVFFAPSGSLVKAIQTDVSGAIYVTTTGSLPVHVDGQISVNNFPTTQNVSGTVGVNNFPVVQAISGSVSVYTQGAQLISGTVGVNNFPAVQAVSGSVNLGNWPQVIAVSGSQLTGSTFAGMPVVVGGVSGSIVKVLQVDVSGAVYVTSTGSLPVHLDSQVSINNFPAVQAVSGSISVYTQGAQLVSGTVTAQVTGTVNLDRGNNVSFPLFITGSIATTAPLVTAVTGSVNVYTQGAQLVSGTVGVNNFPAVQAVSGSISVYTQGAQLVSGAVNLSNWPSVIAVSGSQLTGSTFGGSPVVAGGAYPSVSGSLVRALLVDVSGALYVTTSGSLPVHLDSQVSVNNFPTTQNVSGTLAAVIQNWPSVTGVTGSVSVYTQGAQFVSGVVSVGNWPSVIAVSGSQLTGSTFGGSPVVAGGVFFAPSGSLVRAIQTDVSGAQYITTTGSLLVHLDSALQVGSVSVYTQGAQLISGTVGVNNFPAVQAISGTVSVYTQGAQLVSGTVGVNNFPAVQAVSGSISVYTQGAQLVSGALNLSNWPATIAVSGSQLTGSTFAGMPVVVGGVSGSTVKALLTDVSGALYVTTSGSLPVHLDSQISINNFPTTQNVSGTVGVNNFPAVQAISGSVSVYTQGAQFISGTVGVNNFPAVQAISGSVSVYTQGAQLVSGGVNLSNWPGVIAVSGSQLTGSTFAGSPVVAGGVFFAPSGSLVRAIQTDVSGAQYITTTGSLPVHLDSPVVINFPVVQAISGSVSVYTQGAQLVSGTVGVNNFPAVQAVSGTVSVYTQGAQLVSGAVNLGNWPQVIAVSGSQLTGSTFAGSPVVAGGISGSIVKSLQVDVSGALYVTTTGSLPVHIDSQVSVNNFPATQNVSGTVGVNNFPAVQAVSGSISVYTQGAQFVSGVVSLGNWPAVIAVSGSQLSGSTFGGSPVVAGGVFFAPSGSLVRAIQTDVSGAQYITTTGSLLVHLDSALQVGAVSVYTQGAQFISGTVGVNNFPIVQAISGSVSVYTQGAQFVSGTVGVNNFPAVQAVSGSISVYTQGAQLVSGAVNLSNWPLVIAVSGSQLTGSTFAGMPVVAGGVSGSIVKALQVDVSGAIYVTTSGSLPVHIDSQVSVNNFPATQAVSGTVGAVVQNWPPVHGVTGSVSVYTQGAQLVSGTVGVNNFPAVQAISGSVSVYTQGAQLVSGTVTAQVTGTVNLDRGNNASFPLFITGSLSTTAPPVTAVTGSVNVYTQGAQLVSGTVGVNNFPAVQAISGTVSVYTQGAQLVSGAVNLSNWPSVIAVSGSQLTGSTFAGMPVVVGGVSGSSVKALLTDVSGAVYVTATGSFLVHLDSQVSVNNFPATQNVSGTVGAIIQNWPPVHGVTGSVSVYTQGAQLVSGTVTAQVTGTVNLDRGNSAAVPLFITGSLSTTAPPVTAVTGSVNVYTQGAQLVSGSVTATVTGTVNLDRGNSAAVPLFITGSLSTTAPAVTAVTGSVSVYTQGAQFVSGTVGVNNFPAVQAISGTVSVYTQGAQLVSGNVNLGNWPLIIAVSGSQLTGSTFRGMPEVVGGVFFAQTGSIVTAIQTDVSGAVFVHNLPSSGSTITSVTSSVSNVRLLAANNGRLGAAVFNDSNSGNMYLKLGALASTGSFTVLLRPNGYYEVPFYYNGIIDAVWSAANANTNARVTELS